MSGNGNGLTNIHSVTALGVVAVGGGMAALLPLGLEGKTALVCGVPLLLWLFELVPLFVPTLVLLALAPLALGTAEASMGGLLQTAADPVLLLFFSGFCLAQATHKNGLDDRVVRFAVGWSGGSYQRLIFASMLTAALLSMWMSNVAAASLLFGALGAGLGEGEEKHRGRLLVGIAMGANIGGMITPLGSGPNGIALAEAAPFMRISFVHWMGFALPLAACLLGLAFLLVRGKGVLTEAPPENVERTKRTSPLFVAIGLATIGAWLLEPLHGVSAPLVGCAGCTALFLFRVLDQRDLLAVDWSTLMLVAGGLMVGGLLESSGTIHSFVALAQLDQLHPLGADLLLVFLAAALAGVMSNTAAAIVLIPIALSLQPSAATAVMIAMATSLGMPFVISTPPNAMAVGHGASSRDLLRVGLPVMLIGVLLVGLTGRWALGWLGVE
jgi:sodium-dependent dicarboxylate transporter 2/3/5